MDSDHYWRHTFDATTKAYIWRHNGLPGLALVESMTERAMAIGYRLGEAPAVRAMIVLQGSVSAR